MSTSKKPCRYSPGCCPHGDGCMFYHDPQANENIRTELATLSLTHRATPSTTKSRKTTVPVTKHAREVAVCKYFATGSCRNGESCRYSHTVSEEWKPEVCKFFTSSGCKNGTECQFRHETTSIAPTWGPKILPPHVVNESL